MSQRPFEIMRWESPKEPDLPMLLRLLKREGLEGESMELAGETRSAEMKFDKTAVRVLASGKIQCAFPGYGVIDLDPGDILEINPGILHDVTVIGGEPAVILQAFKD